MPTIEEMRKALKEQEIKTETPEMSIDDMRRALKKSEQPRETVDVGDLSAVGLGALSGIVGEENIPAISEFVQEHSGEYQPQGMIPSGTSEEAYISPQANPPLEGGVSVPTEEIIGALEEAKTKETPYMAGRMTGEIAKYAGLGGGMGSTIAKRMLSGAGAMGAGRMISSGETDLVDRLKEAGEAATTGAVMEGGLGVGGKAVKGAIKQVVKSKPFQAVKGSVEKNVTRLLGKSTQGELKQMQREGAEGINTNFKKIGKHIRENKILKDNVDDTMDAALRARNQKGQVVGRIIKESDGHIFPDKTINKVEELKKKISQNTGLYAESLPRLNRFYDDFLNLYQGKQTIKTSDLHAFRKNLDDYMYNIWKRDKVSDNILKEFRATVEKEITQSLPKNVQKMYGKAKADYRVANTTNVLAENAQRKMANLPSWVEQASIPAMGAGVGAAHGRDLPSAMIGAGAAYAAKPIIKKAAKKGAKALVTGTGRVLDKIERMGTHGDMLKQAATPLKAAVIDYQNHSQDPEYRKKRDAILKAYDKLKD